MKQPLAMFLLNAGGSIYDAAIKISTNKTRTLIIVNDHLKVIGVISEGDLLRSLLNYDAPTISVTDVMNRSFLSWTEKARPCKEQVRRWLRNGALLIPICDASGTVTDVIDVLSETNQLLES